MAKPNFNYIRKLITNKMNDKRSNFSWHIQRKVSQALLAAAVKKASKAQLVDIVLKDGDVYTKLNVPSAGELVQKYQEEVAAPYEALLEQLDSLELKAAMGSDPSEELRKIVAAIEKL